MRNQVSDKDKTIIELLTQRYTKTELDEIEQSDLSYEVLNEKYPVQCIRSEGDFYRVVYASDDKLLILNYDKNGKMLFHRQVTPFATKSEMDSIELGKSVDDVKEIDASGEYYFLYTGRTETPKISTHYTKDGYLFRIRYNDTWEVINIDYELI